MFLKIEYKKIAVMELIGFFVVSVMAILFHFVYDISGQNYLIGLISPTNESVFEHIKMIFFPYIIFSVIEYFVLDIPFKKFFTIKAITAIIIPILLVSFFYIYTGIIGYNILWVDIMSTFIYIFIAFYISYKMLISPKSLTNLFWVVFIVFSVVIFAMIYFSVYPPHIPLFYDRIEHIYGASQT